VPGQPELDLLNLFVAVAETQSFSLAAKRLGLPRSTVSRGIVRLEASLGTHLLHRTTHTVGLTTAGAALFERVAPLVASLRQAVDSLPEQAESPSGTLRITAANDLGIGWLADVVPRFMARHPEVKVDVWLTNAFVDLVAEGVDVALRISRGPMRDSSLVARKLTDLEAQLFAAPAYLARRGIPRSIEELASHDRVVPRGWRDVKELAPLSEGAHVRADDFFFAREVLRHGGGVGILPSFVAQPALEDGSLVRVLPRFMLPNGSLFLVHPRMAHVPAKVVAFKAFVLEQLAARPFFGR
jgi:DNA-binding transcriptional LysR family regulator